MGGRGGKGQESKGKGTEGEEGWEMRGRARLRYLSSGLRVPSYATVGGVLWARLCSELVQAAHSCASVLCRPAGVVVVVVEPILLSPSIVLTAAAASRAGEERCGA